ncbi:Replication factor C subunit 1 [Verticillium dahliae VDG2]|nr:Replication factor C subunit 1 [Verticillium dahliae VDG2]
MSLLAQGIVGGIVGITTTSAIISLRVATNIFLAASDTAIVDTLLQLIHRSLEALTQSLSGAALIWRGIFTNGTNDTSVHFILNHLSELFAFLYDLFKPANVIPRFPIGFGNGQENASVDNPYNELDLRREENRRACIYQVQRVAVTLTSILKMGRGPVPRGGLGDLQMNARLRSDFDKANNPPPPTYDARLEHGQKPIYPDERWLFINGIANEFVWFQRSCDKLRDTFRRDVRGVFNRSDGFLWDLIECCGERSAADAAGNDIIARTQSSRAAQDVLARELAAALRRDMAERLHVFTFGNPSVDWRVLDGGEVRPLSAYARVTEHFAHRADFVAMLGCVTQAAGAESGYAGAPVFSNGGRGHLFGAHYSLGAESYVDGDNSKLLKAVAGRPLWLEE